MTKKYVSEENKETVKELSDHFLRDKSICFMSQTHVQRIIALHLAYHELQAALPRDMQITFLNPIFNVVDMYYDENLSGPYNVLNTEMAIKRIYDVFNQSDGEKNKGVIVDPRKYPFFEENVRRYHHNTGSLPRVSGSDIPERGILRTLTTIARLTLVGPSPESYKWTTSSQNHFVSRVYPTKYMND